MSDSHPFETTEQGYYKAVQPAKGMHPETLTVRMGDREYVLHGLTGRGKESRVCPDVLLYEELEVREDVPTASESVHAGETA